MKFKRSQVRPPPGLGNLYKRGGLHSTEIAEIASHPAASGSILGVCKNFFSLEVAEIA